MERATTWKPNVEISPTCPRCGSMNTKFCYYNNYSLTQPRYFCKGCRRYWTKGGSLRNVPVGGGCRKSRRGKSISGATSNKGLDRRLFISENNSGGSTSPAAAATNGANIDLAAVYANFMNQKPHPQPQPGHIIPETLANNAGAGPSFEFSGYPTMLNVDYFVPENTIAPHQDGGFVVDEYGNQAVLFQEQFCSNNNDDHHQMMTNCVTSLPPIGWSNDNSDMNMMFPLQTSTHEAAVIEPEVQGCPNHHHTNSSASLFSIPSYESIFRP